MRCFGVGVLLCAGLAGMLEAQAPAGAPPVDSTAIVNVRLTDGTQLIGRVVARDDSSLTMLTIGGLRVTAPLRTVMRWRAERGRLVSGRFRPADPNTSRLFLMPTARTLEGGSGYFADYFLFFPFVGFGFTDRLTVSGGMSLIPGISSQLLYLAPKIGIVRSPTVNVAAGGIYLTVPEESGWVGAAYGVVTLGSEETAVTALVGYAFENGDRSSAPGVIVGAEHRLGEGTKLLAEAWKFPDAEVIPAVFGLRFFGRRVSADFGLLTVLGESTEGFPFLPWLNFAVSF